MWVAHEYKNYFTEECNSIVFLTSFGQYEKEFEN